MENSLPIKLFGQDNLPWFYEAQYTERPHGIEYQVYEVVPSGTKDHKVFLWEGAADLKPHRLKGHLTAQLCKKFTLNPEPIEKPAWAALLSPRTVHLSNHDRALLQRIAEAVENIKTGPTLVGVNPAQPEADKTVAPQVKSDAEKSHDYEQAKARILRAGTSEEVRTVTLNLNDYQCAKLPEKHCGRVELGSPVMTPYGLGKVTALGTTGHGRRDYQVKHVGSYTQWFTEDNLTLLEPVK